MSSEIAFVGDIHGCLAALQGLMATLDSRGTQHTVFLGDYINKGPDSAGVMNELVRAAEKGDATLLRGNHEAALLDAIESGDLTPFLKMGGAMAIRSYVGTHVGPDVVGELRDALPPTHLDALRNTTMAYERGDLIAQHDPLRHRTSKFRITAHSPVGVEPRIGDRFAQIDTGCGTAGGRLTALLWPSCDFVQVDIGGALVVAASLMRFSFRQQVEN